jgi:hypothetical protein
MLGMPHHAREWKIHTIWISIPELPMGIDVSRARIVGIKSHVHLIANAVALVRGSPDIYSRT